MLVVKKVLHDSFKANSYFLIENDNCIVIDCNNNTLDFICANNLNPVCVFLTHEHFDHITGVTKLKERFPQMMIISSKETSQLMQNSRGNMSYYYDGVGIVESGADIFIDDTPVFKFLEYDINTFFAPGHTSSGILIHINNMLFTGDTLLDIKTPTNMPNSSKKQLIESLDFIDSYFDDNTIFYQGHGEPFPKSKWDKNISIGVKKK